MARVTPALVAFNAGEWTPELHGRTDLPKYSKALKECRNFITKYQGPATRRPASRYVCSTKNDGLARLINFEFSTVQAYGIEAGDLYFRFYKDRGRIESPPGTPVEIVSPYSAANIGPSKLKWTQSADTLYLLCPTVQTRKLLRASHTSWSFATYAPADGPYLAVNTTATTIAPSAVSGAGITLLASAPLFAATDVGRLVRIKNGATWGYATITAFTDSTHVTATVGSNFAATTANVNWRLGAWSDTTGWPTVALFFQQRLWFANTSSQPNTIWGTVSGDYENMAPSDINGTVTDSSAVTFTIADNQVNAIIWLAGGRSLLIGTVGGEFSLSGSSTSPTITPTNVTILPGSNEGSGNEPSVRVGGAVLFAQRSRRKLHQLVYSYADDSYGTDEASVGGAHLLRPFLAEMVYQREPWKQLWGYRDDGMLLGLSYVPKQDVTGWQQHPVAGRAARTIAITSIPGSTQDEVWMVNQRTINGATKRYVEYLGYEWYPDDLTSLDYAQFLDAGATYDGWNTNGAQTLQLTGADFSRGASVTMTAAGFTPFAPGDVGKFYRFRNATLIPSTVDPDELVPTLWPAIGVQITAYTSNTVVTVKLFNAAPAILQGAAVSYWGLAATTISGLSYLEGELVDLLVDGAPAPSKTVSGGAITLDRAGVVVQAGLGYRSRLETLDIDAGGSDGSAIGKQQAIHHATIKFFATLGCKYGSDDANLDEALFRATGDAMNQPPPLFTGNKTVEWPDGYEQGKRIVIVQDQPLPITVTAIAPVLSTND